MEDIIFIECGKKRKGEKYNCENCGKEFIRRKSNSWKKRFCSRTCSASSRRDRIMIQCAQCGKEFEKAQSKINLPKHGFHFCSRKCKDLGQSFDGNCPEIKVTYYGENFLNYRGLLRKEIKKGCSVCNEQRIQTICVHHIDGDHNNNARENLEVVCRNCHAIRHMTLNKNNEWNFCSSFLTPRDIVEEFDKNLRKTMGL